MPSTSKLWDDIFKQSGMGRSWDGVSDEEAESLYLLWKNSPAGGILTASSKEGDAIMGLKAKGYVRGFGNSLELTQLGKRLIREMATHEPNSFEKNAKVPSYSEIKNKKASRPRQSHVAKQSKVASRQGSVFNLRKESLSRMQATAQENPGALAMILGKAREQLKALFLSLGTELVFEYKNSPQVRRLIDPIKEKTGQLLVDLDRLERQLP